MKREYENLFSTQIQIKGLVQIVQIGQREYKALVKNKVLVLTRTGYEGVALCSKNKKSSGRSYYVRDDLKRKADKIIKENVKNKI